MARLNPRKVTTRKVPVVFDQRIAGSLVSHLASAINGASVARKTSFLRDKMGAKLFADGIRIVDDPLRKRGLRSHPFDGEGVPERNSRWSMTACFAHGCSIARPRANLAS